MFLAVLRSRPKKRMTLNGNLCQNLCLLLLMILHRLSRFFDYILLWIWFAVNVWTRIFLYVLKDKSSCFTLPTVVFEKLSSLAILFADFRFLFKHTFRLILAISCRPGGDLADIAPRVIRVYHLYNVAIETVLLSLPYISQEQLNPSRYKIWRIFEC